MTSKIESIITELSLYVLPPYKAFNCEDIKETIEHLEEHAAVDCRRCLQATLLLNFLKIMDLDKIDEYLETELKSSKVNKIICSCDDFNGEKILSIRCKLHFKGKLHCSGCDLDYIPFYDDQNNHAYCMGCLAKKYPKYWNIIWRDKS